MDRSILHVDINNCYASIEQLYNPRLRGIPIVVGGDQEARHGIVLAKSNEAKAYGIKTAETLVEARAKCPHALIVPPQFDLYFDVCTRVRKVFSEFTDQVEPFGIDEAWLDVTDSQHLFGDGTQIAEQVRYRIRKEIGVTVSVGVSYNKIFAKLGSDMKKPDAVTTIPRERYRQMVWPLPVSDLLYVGRATGTKLAARSVRTIGDLAQTPPGRLRSWFGKVGVILHCFANGQDISPVSATGSESIIKSIGHSTTTPRDLVSEQDCKIVFILLAECVAERLRDHGFKARTVQISLRSRDLIWFERQTKLASPSNVTGDLVESAMALLRQHYNFAQRQPLRSIGIRTADLVPADTVLQTSFFITEAQRDKAQRLEEAIDGLRRRHGHGAIKRAVTVLDESLLQVSPKDSHGAQISGFSK